MKSPAAGLGGGWRPPGFHAVGGSGLLVFYSKRTEPWKSEIIVSVGRPSNSVDISQFSRNRCAASSKGKAYRKGLLDEMIDGERLLQDQAAAEDRGVDLNLLVFCDVISLPHDLLLLENWRHLRIDKSHSEPINKCLPCRVALLQMKSIPANGSPPKPDQGCLINSAAAFPPLDGSSSKERTQPRLGFKLVPKRSCVWRPWPPAGELAGDHVVSLRLSSTLAADCADLECSPDGEKADDEAIPRPFAKLPELILCKIFKHLDAENLTRIERVCSQWQRVCKQAWTASTTQNLNLATYYLRNCAKDVLRKCGPYLKQFLFTSSRSRFTLACEDRFIFLKGVYGLRNVDSVCIRGIYLRRVRDSDSRYELAQEFLRWNFANVKELILAGGVALECVHFGYCVSAAAVDDFARHIALLVNLRELSLGLTEELAPCSSCGCSSEEDPSDDFGLSDATMRSIAEGCKRLTAILIYHATRVSDAVVPKVISRLRNIEVFWRAGKFLFPPIHDRGDFDNATSLLNGTWVRRALERKGYDVDNECDFEEYFQRVKPLP